MRLSTLLAEYWPDDANMVGHAYLAVIAKEVENGTETASSIFKKTEGDHAYGIEGAIEHLFSAATLVVGCWQLLQSKKNDREVERALLETLCTSLPEDRARELADKLLGEVTKTSKME